MEGIGSDVWRLGENAQAREFVTANKFSSYYITLRLPRGLAKGKAKGYALIGPIEAPLIRIEYVTGQPYRYEFHIRFLDFRWLLIGSFPGCLGTLVNNINGFSDAKGGIFDCDQFSVSCPAVSLKHPNCADVRSISGRLGNNAFW